MHEYFLVDVTYRTNDRFACGEVSKWFEMQLRIRVTYFFTRFVNISERCDNRWRWELNLIIVTDYYNNS